MAMTMPQPTGFMLRLAMLGDGGVGKTALVVQLCLNKFVETYDPTIEDSYRKRILLDDDATTLELMDTAGQEEYVSLRDQWIRDGEGFLLVYSVTQRLSFTRIKQYYSEIKRIKGDVPFAVVLVGNKVDQNLDRVVTTQEGEQLAKSWGILFLETSAKLNINAEEAFVTLARLTRDKNQMEEVEGTSVCEIPTPSIMSDFNGQYNPGFPHHSYNQGLPYGQIPKLQPHLPDASNYQQNGLLSAFSENPPNHPSLRLQRYIQDHHQSQAEAEFYVRAQEVQMQPRWYVQPNQYQMSPQSPQQPQYMDYSPATEHNYRPSYYWENAYPDQRYSEDQRRSWAETNLTSPSRQRSSSQKNYSDQQSLRSRQASQSSTSSIAVSSLAQHKRDVSMSTLQTTGTGRSKTQKPDQKAKRKKCCVM